MELWILAILLLAVGLGLAVLEVFFPSGGILGFLCFCSIVGAVIVGFRHSTATGTGILITALIGVPVIVMLALQWLPQTYFGRKIILDVPTRDQVMPDDEKSRALKTLVGKEGQAKTKMLPAGVVKIEGRSVDCVSEGVAVEPGQWVRVIEVHGNRVVVRPLDKDETPNAPRPGDPLAQPIDTVALDPFDEEDESST